MVSPPLLAASSQFSGWDWLVVIGYLAFTTWLGTKLAGKQSSMRDYFLGGRKLPWYAVSGSIIATEISALTFVVVPFVVFRPGGNFTYLQLGIFGTFFARVIVGYWLVPAYYKREIYSPYDYMGHQLGKSVRSMTTALFALGGVLAQFARIYLTAEVLNVVLHDQLKWLSESFGLDPLAWAIIFIGIVATAWTLMGGISTVIWTDVMLFLLFAIGAAIALVSISVAIDGGLGRIIRMGWEARQTDHWYDWGKFTFFDFTTRYPEVMTRQYTIWTGVFAATWGSLHPYGCDQLLVQRMFCCKGPREARWAMISSTCSQFVTLTVAFVGVGLFAYYALHPLAGEELAMYEDKGDRIFPIFIARSGAIPVGFRGLIIAGVIAAAISSLTSILAALSQTVMSVLFGKLVEEDDSLSADQQTAKDRRAVLTGRGLVLIWGIVLCVMAYLAQHIAEKYPSILDLGLAMAGYAGGALLAGFVLGFLPLGITGRGYLWSAPLSVLYIFAAVWHEPWTAWVCWTGGGVLAAFWLAMMPSHRAASASPILPRAAQTLILALGIAGMIVVNRYGFWGSGDNAKTIAWPWYVPIGSTVAFVLGYLLTDRRTDARPE